MRGKLSPVGWNRLLGCPSDVMIQVAIQLSLLRHIHLNCFVKAKQPNARINAAGSIERSIQSSRMTSKLRPLALNELLCGAQLSLELSRDELISSSVISIFNSISFQLRRITPELTGRDEPPKQHSLAHEGNAIRAPVE